MKKSLNNDAIEFLLFSYFNEEYSKLVDNKELMIQACTNRAYLDLSRTLKYAINYDQLEKMKKDKHDEIVQEKQRFKANILKCIKKAVINENPNLSSPIEWEGPAWIRVSKQRNQI